MVAVPTSTGELSAAAPGKAGSASSLAVSCACADDLCHRGRLSDGLFGSFKLFKWDGVSPTKQFVGLQNYLTLLLNHPVFWIALRNNAIWLGGVSSSSHQHRLGVGGVLATKSSGAATSFGVCWSSRFIYTRHRRANLELDLSSPYRPHQSDPGCARPNWLAA